MAERRLIYRDDALTPRVEIRHGIPGIGHPDRAAFDVLALVAVPAIERALAAADLEGSVGANTRVIHTSRFGVPATLNLDVLADADDLEAIEMAVIGALETLAAGQVDADDLELAKKTLRTQWYRKVADADALAFEIGHFQTMDRWQTLQTHLQQRDAADAAQISRLASRYFEADNRVVGIVRPRTQGAGR